MPMLIIGFMYHRDTGILNILAFQQENIFTNNIKIYEKTKMKMLELCKNEYRNYFFKNKIR